MKESFIMKAKQHISVIAAIILCGVMAACGGKQSGEQQKEPAKPKTTAQQTKPSSQPIATINIYRYDNFPVAKAEQLKNELQKVYPSVRLAKASIPLPPECYYKPRDRYRGTGLLDDLMKLRHGGYALGLTRKIIYDKNEISSTFGVFGISYMGDSVSVISSLRPKTLKPLSDEELQELMLHELGHAFGLPHCKDERCMMVDAEHGNKFAQTQSFCNDCKKYLNNKGWKL